MHGTGTLCTNCDKENVRRITELEAKLAKATECLAELIVGDYVGECGRAIIDDTGLLTHKSAEEAS